MVYFQYKGVRIPAQIQFPESESFDKQYKFTYTDNNKINLTLSLNIETYFPSFEKTSTRNRANVMDKILVAHKDPNGGVLKSDWTDQNT